MRLIAGMLALQLAMTGQAAVAAETSENWYVVRISGSPVGFSSEISVADSGSIVFRAHTDMTMTRMGAPLALFMMVEEVTDGEGNFQKVSLEMEMSISGMKAEAVLEGDTLEYRVDSGGATRTTRTAWDPRAISLWQADRLTRAWLAERRHEFAYRFFDVTDGDFKGMRSVRRGYDTQVIDGASVRLLRVEEYEGDDDAPSSTTWYDGEHNARRTVIRQMGMEIVIDRITVEEVATIAVEPNFDIIRQSMIPCEGYPDPPSRAETVTMHLSLAQPLPRGRRFEGPNQRELARGRHHLVLVLSRENLNRLPLPDRNREKFLAPDMYIQSDHPDIRSVADSLRATGATGWELAQLAARWVSGYINNKNFEQGFASALEVLQTRAGDCTEHSVLLTAVLRAAGIPARPAVGLAYAEGNLIGHMWAEAYVDYWRTLDALDLETNPTRIRVSTSEDGSVVNERDMMQAYSIVAGMRVRVTDATLRP